MSDKQTFYRDKPYVFIPLIEAAKRLPRTDRQLMLLQGECGTLSVEIHAETPVHIGSGSTRFANGKFTRPLQREGNRVILPGSGFKGMLRAVAEALSESCILLSPANVQAAKPPNNRRVCPTETGLCPACSLFGCLGYKGKLTFSTFRASEYQLTEERLIPMLEAPFKDYPRVEGNKDRGNERLYYGEFSDVHGTDVCNLTKQEYFHRKGIEPQTMTRFYGRKCYRHSKRYGELSQNSVDSYECLPVGSILRGTITYQGLTVNELGLLLTALGVGWDQPIMHKLGYAKPAFLGSVTLSITPIPLPARYGKPALTPEKMVEVARQYRTEAHDQVKAAVAALQDIWSDFDQQLYWHTEGGNRQIY